MNDTATTDSTVAETGARVGQDGDRVPDAVVVPPRAKNSLHMLWLFVYGHVLFFFLKLCYRPLLRDVMSLAVHLEDAVFPGLRRHGQRWLTLRLTRRDESHELSAVGGDERFELPGLGGLARALAHLDIGEVRLDTYLEYGQIVDAFVLLRYVAPHLGDAEPRDDCPATWSRTIIASAMVGARGFHNFCSTMRFDRTRKLFEVEYTFCELVFSHVVKSIVARYSRTRDHRALFAAAPFVTLAMLLLFSAIGLCLLGDYTVGAWLYIGVAIVTSVGLGYAVYGFGAQLYAQEHQSALARGYVTKIQELLTQIEASYEQLRDLEKLRDDLVHMIVHDMKNPLFSMVLVLELLKQEGAGKLDEEDAQHVDELLALTRGLVEMVSSLLDVSRLEEGKMPVHREPCDLVAVATEAVERLWPLARRKELRVERPDTQVSVFCDPELIGRVVANLVSNGMRYAKRGGTVTISFRAKEGSGEVRVTDTGPGIPAKYRQHIFEKFGRVEGEVERMAYSTGLGLTFCKLAIEANNGTIGVESEEGRGSCFWFALPRSDDTTTKD